MDALAAIVGKTVELRFESVDATPDLHEFGAITARVTKATPEGSPPAPRIEAAILSPALMRGLVAKASLRYEGETLEAALQGTAVGVTVTFEDKGGRAVAGGLGTLAFKRG